MFHYTRFVRTENLVRRAHPLYSRSLRPTHIIFLPFSRPHYAGRRFVFIYDRHYGFVFSILHGPSSSTYGPQHFFPSGYPNQPCETAAFENRVAVENRRKPYAVVLTGNLHVYLIVKYSSGPGRHSEIRIDENDDTFIFGCQTYWRQRMTLLSEII